MYQPGPTASPTFLQVKNDFVVLWYLCVGITIRPGVVFDWVRLENFLIIRDRPVGNQVTSRKCHKIQ